MRPSYVMELKELCLIIAALDTSIIGAIKVEHDYGMIMVPKSGHNHCDNQILIGL
jgi:hypothetical protein